MPSANHDLRDGHSTRHQSFRFGKSTYNAINNNSLSQFLSNLTMSLSISIILCNIIATTSANIRLERCYFCGHPILCPALLPLDDRAESGLSKEPWVNPSKKDLRRSTCPDAAAGRPSWSIVSLLLFAFACFLLVIVQYRTYRTADTKPPEANSFI